jgi:hypothetical protein
MDKFLLQRLASQLSRGELILFTGAGFSLAAYSRTGAPLPSVAKLREILWDLAFTNEPIDEASRLGDIYDVAAKKAGRS